MRKSNVVKAMACFMAATMAITCVPSTNVTNGVSVVAEAASSTDNPDGSQTLVGTEWWNTASKSKEYTLAKDSTLILYVEAQDLADDNFGVFSVELKSTENDGTQGYYFTTNSDKRAWTAEASAGKGVITGALEESNKELLEGHIYKITIKRSGTKNFEVTYHDEIANKEYHKFTLTDSNFPDADVNVHVNAQFGTYKVGKTFDLNRCERIDPSYDNTPAAKVPFEFKATLIGEYESKNVTDTITAAAINGKVTTEIKKGSNANEYIFSVTPDKEEEGFVIVTTGSIQQINNGEGKKHSFKFKAIANKCTDLTCLKAEKVNNSLYRYPTYRLKARIGEAFPFTVTAIAANQNIKLGGEFTAKTVSGSSVMVATAFEKKADGTDDTNKPLYEYDNNGIRKTAGNRVLDVLIKEVKAGENAFEFRFGDKTITMIVEGVTNITGTNIGGSPTTPGDTNKPTDTNKPEDTNKPTDTNKPEDTNKPTDTNKPEDTNKPTDTNKPEDTNKPTTTTKKKKKATVKSAKAKKGKKIVSGTIKLSSGKVVKKATVKVYVNNKKKATTKTNNKGKFSVKLSKKLKKGDKVKLVITKSTIKKITKTIKVK